MKQTFYCQRCAQDYKDHEVEYPVTICQECEDEWEEIVGEMFERFVKGYKRKDMAPTETEISRIFNCCWDSFDGFKFNGHKNDESCDQFKFNKKKLA